MYRYTIQLNCTVTGTLYRYGYRYTVYVQRYRYIISLHCIGKGLHCRYRITLQVQVNFTGTGYLYRYRLTVQVKVKCP